MSPIFPHCKSNVECLDACVLLCECLTLDINSNTQFDLFLSYPFFFVLVAVNVYAFPTFASFVLFCSL